MDGQFKSMERRFDSVEAKLGEQTRLLKAHTDTQVQNLRQELQEGFASMDEKLDALATQGHIRRGRGGRLRPVQPLPLRGKPLSEMIIEDLG